jgi:hypothetical protein
MSVIVSSLVRCQGQSDFIPRRRRAQVACMKRLWMRLAAAWYDEQAMAIRIRSALRKLYAEKTFELTNIGAGALLFRQFLSDRAFSWLATGVSLVLVGVGYLASYIFYQGGEK